MGRRRYTLVGATLAVAAAALGVSCGGGRAAPASSFACDPDDGGIALPEGLCAAVFADGIGTVRHLAVDEEGDVYAARRPSFRRTESGFERDSAGGVLALRDSDGDGRADRVEPVNDVAGTGVAVHDGYLYYSSTTEVFRVRLRPGELLPTSEPESVVSGFPQQGQHAAKALAFDGAGHMFVSVGAPSNACQERTRTPGSPGLDPCPQREWQAAIWRFDAAQLGQTQQQDGTRYASGIRNGMALDWNEQAGALFAMQHGRDSLHDLFPELFTLEQSAELPAEEMFRIAEGDDFGWPYCYYDPFERRKVLGPEYGGDGTEVGRCADVSPTLLAFPAHWAPNDLLFYRSGALGERYRGGAFIAFHGSWNRMPFPQQGYRVVFVPFRDGAPAGDPEDFATGFAGVDVVNRPNDAHYRPTGLAEGPDGSLYISSDAGGGRIWRIRRRAEGA